MQAILFVIKLLLVGAAFAFGGPAVGFVSLLILAMHGEAAR